jgi:hypothetical protein
VQLARDRVATFGDPQLLALLALGFGLRLALILAGVGQPPARWEYDAIAAHWLAGDGYVYEHLAGVSYHAYYSGLPYVALLALCRALTQSDLPMQLVQAALALVSAWSAAALARPLGGRRAGHVAAALTLVAPGLLYYDIAQIHPLGLDTALTVLAVVALQRALAGTGRVSVAAAGALLGLALLQHNSLLAFAVLTPIVLCIWKRARLGGALALGIVAVAGPWLLRNALVLGTPLLVSTTGEHFWIGNAPGSTGGALFPSGEPVIATVPPNVAAALATSDERQQQRLFWRLSLAAVQDRPLAFASGVLLKFAGFWTLAPHVGQRYPHWWTWIETAWFSALALAAAVGSARLWRRASARPSLVIIMGVCLTVSAVHALLYFELRHRFVLEPLLAVLAATAWASLASAPKYRESAVGWEREV